MLDGYQPGDAPCFALVDFFTFESEASPVLEGKVGTLAILK